MPNTRAGTSTQDFHDVRDEPVTMQRLLEFFQAMQATSNGSHSSNVGNLTFDKFNADEETFMVYKERLEVFFKLKQVADDTRSLILLNSIGTKYYQLLANLTSPDLPTTKSYGSLVELLTNHLCPEPNDISEQHKFGQIQQRELQSISDFVADLKKAAVFCKFICESCRHSTLNTHLRSQFVRGLFDSDIRERLLLEKNVTFDNAVKMASAIESSKCNSRIIQGKQFQNVHQQIVVDGPKRIVCFKCGAVGHKSYSCQKKMLKCLKCKKMGHVASVCKATIINQDRIHCADISDEKAVMEPEIFNIQAISNHNNAKIYVEMYVENQPISFEFDTGSSVTTINEDTFKYKFPNVMLKPTTIQLLAYNMELIPVIGEAIVSVKFKDETNELPIYVVKSGLDSICGRSWINAFRLFTFPNINCIQNDELTNKIIKEYSTVFEDKIGTIPNVVGDFKLREDAKPIYLKPRNVPFAIRKLVEDEINRLEQDGIFEKVNDSDWGTPVVPILKSATQVRLCADYKVTLNKCIINDKYPIPRIEDLYQSLCGSKYFCVLDIHKAYLHLSMSDESSLMQTVSTHRGLFKVKKLMFGVKNAPNVWQRFMDKNIVKGLDGVACFFDDIIVSGKNLIETEQKLRLILNRIRENNLHCGLKKCKFFKTSVTYLGHKIDCNGLQKTPEKIEAILKVEAPKNCDELRRFLGMVNYYNNFIPNLSTKLYHLNRLLKKDVDYDWSSDCEVAFQNIKKELTCDNVLMMFDENLPLILATDASPYGLSAILSHLTPLGERPIAFASRSLTKSESNYSHIDKEATAIYWGLHKFFNYCYGREFTLYCDNKPLTSIFSPDKKLPVLTAQRFLHYAQFMSGFKYNIQYRKAEDHLNVDYLSREPLNACEMSTTNLYQISESILPVTSKVIAEEIQKDSELLGLYNSLMNGTRIQSENYKGKEELLMIQSGCIYLGDRVIIPKALQSEIISELHVGHMGIVRMKELARSYCYWFNIDRDIEAVAKNCRGCAMVAKEPSKSKHIWEEPSEAWQRVHCDFAGPFLNKYFMVVVDAKTKWIEVVMLNSTTSHLTIRALREIFSRFGLPDIFVTDNGTNFTSYEFEEFMKKNGILHRKIAPGHPATNGQAERFVQTVKNSLRSSLETSQDIHLNLHQFLMQYRKTPGSNKLSPSEQMLSFKLKTRLDLIKQNPVLKNNLEPKNEKSARKFDVGEKVQFRNYRGKNKWNFGSIKQQLGKCHYLILYRDMVVKRHLDQIRSTNVLDNISDHNLFLST